MRFANYDEMEEAVRDEYEEQILQLKEEAISLHKQIDELKADVNYAEAEIDKVQQEAQSHREVIVRYHKFFDWTHENYPDIITTYRVINRLEGTDGDRVDSTE